MPFEIFGCFLVFWTGGCQGYMMFMWVELKRLISQVKTMGSALSYNCPKEKHVLYTKFSSNLRNTNGISVPSVKFDFRNLDGSSGDGFN
jgi:hypothetical protein